MGSPGLPEEDLRDSSSFEESDRDRGSDPATRDHHDLLLRANLVDARPQSFDRDVERVPGLDGVRIPDIKE